MSDPFNVDMTVEINDDLTVATSDTGAPTTSKKRSREDDSTGDQSLRGGKKAKTTPDLPPTVASNPILNLFSLKALETVREQGEDIYLNWNMSNEDPEFAAYVEKQFEENEITTVDLKQHFEQGKLPRSKDRDLSALDLSLGTNTTRITEENVSDTFATFYKKEIGVGNNTRTGFFSEKGVIESGAQNFTDIMDIDIASLFSQTIITYLKEKAQTTTEIQAMVLPDRIFLSANESDSVKALVGKRLDDILNVTRTYRTVKKTGKIMLDSDTKKPIPTVDDERNERAGMIKDLTKVLAGSNPSPEMGQYLTTIMVSALKSPEQADNIVTLFKALDANAVFVDASGSNDLASFITGPAYVNKIILVGSGDNCHAEQNLMIGIARAGYTGSAVVAGTKRPCQTCECAFVLLSECKNSNVVWYERAGGAWSGSTKKSFSALTNLLKVRLDDVQKIAKKLLVDEGQFATSFDRDAPDQIMTSGFRDAATKKPKKGEEITYTDRIPRPKLLPEKAFEEVRPYEPGSPQSSQESGYSQGSQLFEDEYEGLQKDLEIPIEEIYRNLQSDDVVMEETEGDGGKS